MKTLFTILLVAFFGVQSWSETPKSDTTSKALLSYALPSKLDWKQFSSEEMVKDMQMFTLGEDKEIRLMSHQIGNEKLWEKFSTMDKEAIYKQLVEGKTLIHKIMSYKDWKADKTLTKKSSKEIIFELDGSFTQENVKNYFVEKYYMTPYGFILISLDWTDKADAKLAKKAKDEFNNITFKSEIK